MTTHCDKKLFPFALKSTIEQHIYNLLVDDIIALGYDIIRIQLSGNKRSTLQIMVEPTDLRLLNIDDCSKISRHISPILDVDDIMGSKKYHLEVSSTGVDRPLTRPCDIKRFIGEDIMISLHVAISGMKKLKARLVNFDNKKQEVLCDYYDVKQENTLHLGIALHLIQSLFLIYRY